MIAHPKSSGVLASGRVRLSVPTKRGVINSTILLGFSLLEVQREDLSQIP